VAASRLLPSGKGASEPANPQDPHAAENRRVRIVNLN
jgi:flagellar motor protein MotB